MEHERRRTAVNELEGVELPLVEGEHLLLGALLRGMRRRAEAEERAAAGRGDARVADAMRALAAAVEEAAVRCEDSYARAYPADWKTHIYEQGEGEAEF